MSSFTISEYSGSGLTGRFPNCSAYCLRLSLEPVCCKVYPEIAKTSLIDTSQRVHWEIVWFLRALGLFKRFFRLESDPKIGS